MAFVTFVGINACSSDDDVVFIAQPDPEGIAFVNSFNETYILTPATAGNVAERFVWNTVDFDAPTNITYELLGSSDAEFSSSQPLGETTGNNLAVSVSDLMELAEEAGLDADPETENPNTGTLYFKVRAYAGNSGGNPLDVVSQVSSFTVVLPEGEGEPALRNFFMVGDVTAAGWSENNNNTPLFRDPDNADLYTFTGRFAGGDGKEGFKLLEILGKWQPQWGLDNGNLTNSDLLGEDPKAFPVTSDGYFTFTVNADEMTYSFEPFDAAGTPTYATIGFLGDATPGGWDADTDLTKSAFNPHIWYANAVELVNGEMKFRANDAWDMNWGAGTAISGQAVKDGSNIPVSAGTYDIWFNDLTGHYILIPIAE